MRRALLVSSKSKTLRLIVTVAAGLFLLAATSAFVARRGSARRNPTAEYLILANNDLGMHCIQPDYSAFLILPPGNNIRIQVFRRGAREAELITKGITVAYRINHNTYSAGKTNFWQYAAGYGYNVPPNVGITGQRLQGVCRLAEDGLYYTATAIPVIPFNDGQTKENPYQTATITVRDAKTGRILAVEDKLVVPVSIEMLCSNCHGAVNTDANILRAHDERSKTDLYADLLKNIRHRCNECHRDNILKAPGRPGVPALSQAMHGFHAGKMYLSTLEIPCYNCHPGVTTKCNRGAMAAAGLTCDDPKCHGSMAQVARSQLLGRQAWLNEPDCSVCHGELFAANPGALYRDSLLVNGPAPMKDLILCASCHNSPHAEWPSLLRLDNHIPLEIYGRPNFIEECYACHQGKGALHGRGAGEGEE